jgi:hypothetical protein
VTRTHHKQQLTLHLSGPHLALLRKLNFPGSERILATAVLTNGGLALTGCHYEFEELVGWVACEANHTRSPRRADLLNEIADELEAILRGNYF